jgi:hypothetical protein
MRPVHGLRNASNHYGSLSYGCRSGASGTQGVFVN